MAPFSSFSPAQITNSTSPSRTKIHLENSCGRLSHMGSNKLYFKYSWIEGLWWNFQSLTRDVSATLVGVRRNAQLCCAGNGFDLWISEAGNVVPGPDCSCVNTCAQVFCTVLQANRISPTKCNSFLRLYWSALVSPIRLIVSLRVAQWNT